MADPVDLGIDPGPEVTMNYEPVPRGPVLSSTGVLSRSYLNWFNGQDRMLGEIVSGVNRYRQTIITLASETEGEFDTLTASIESVAEVATDNETAIASLTTEIVAARQGETDLSARITEVDTARVDGDSALATSISTLSSTVGNISAEVTNIAEAYATDSTATARLIWTVNTSTNVATIEQTAAEGYDDGTWNGSAITLTADKITLDGDVIITGTFNRDRFATGEIPALTAEGVSANYYEQAADPAPVPNGSLWFETDTNNLYIRRSGSWGLIANIAGNPVKATVSGSYVDIRVGTGTRNTGSITITATGGTGSYTYSHELIITDNPDAVSVTLNSPTSATFSVSSGSESPVKLVTFLVISTVSDSAGEIFQITRGGALGWET